MWADEREELKYRPEYAVKIVLNGCENIHLMVTWKGFGLEVNQYNKEPKWEIILKTGRLIYNVYNK